MAPTKQLTLEDCRDLDSSDTLAAYRQRFAFSSNGNINFDANSMGAMAVDVPDRIQKLLTDGWRDKSRRAWTTEGWVDRPRELGAKISHMIGAGENDVVVCDNTTLNLYKLLSRAWRIKAGGNVILTEAHNFPTDLHVAQGLVGFLKELDVDIRLVAVETREELVEMMSPEVAILYLTQVDYRSSERWNLAEMNALARSNDALTVWDLSQSSGALDVDVLGADTDFAVGCGYKYLCGGPGGPAYLYIHPRHQKSSWPTIAGWLGHKEWDKFSTQYEPASDARSHLTGTPPVVANEIFSAAADIWQEVERTDVARKHESLTETLIQLLEQECGALGVELNSPRDYQQRGGHISFRHEGAGPVSEAMVDHGLVGSFRYPDAIRLGMSPLYHSHEDIWNAVQIVKNVLSSEVWREPKYEKVSV